VTTLETAAPVALAPPALLREDHELPWVDLGGGIEIKVLQVDLDNGVWIVRNRFAPGAVVQTHKHTGSVNAFTETGSWYYAEYPHEINRPGSYLFEPAGSTHTLTVPDSNEEPTLVWFVIHGANLNLAADGSIDTVIDAQVILDFYLLLAEAGGHPRPKVIGMPEDYTISLPKDATLRVQR
jgi:quercetin dioxygenase-like cupin family protein